jgi:hypothetical protein
LNYTVVAPPMGAAVDELPDSYATTTINGFEYYIVDGTYYQSMYVNGQVAFVAVPPPE